MILFTQGPMLQKFIRAKITSFRNKLVYVPGRPLQPRLMFASKAGALSDAPL